jgi:metallo-beta-lactamase class B
MRADVFLANHPNFFDFDAKRARLLAGDADAFVDAKALAAFNTRMRDAFERELAKQMKADQAK